MARVTRRSFNGGGSISGMSWQRALELSASVISLPVTLHRACPVK
jgi:hypothetical protein